MLGFPTIVELLEDIQRDALNRISDLEDELRGVETDELGNKIKDKFGNIIKDDRILDFDAGLELINKHLWRGGNNKSSKKKIEENSTVYYAMADGIARAVRRWKEEFKEMPLLDKLDIWVSYNSKLADPNWIKPTRVLAGRKSGEYKSYYCENLNSKRKDDKPLGKPDIKSTAIWFGTLQIPFESKKRIIVSDGDSSAADSSAKTIKVTPTVHDYLSTLNPHFKGATDDQRIKTVVFYVREYDESKNNWEIELINQQSRALARSSTRHDLYVKLPRQDEFYNIYKTIYRKLFHPDIKFEVDGETVQRDIAIIEEINKNNLIKRQWARRYATVLSCFLLRENEEELRKEVDKVRDLEFKAELERAHNRHRELLKSVAPLPKENPLRCMANIYISVPGSSGDLGSVIVFADQLIGPMLTKFIATAVYPVFSYLRQIEESVIAVNNFKRHATRSGIAAIMGRNMSHNIGSHVIWHLSQEIRKDGDRLIAPEGNDRFFSYLQQRIYFIAQITTAMVSWSQTIKWRELLENFIHSQKALDNLAHNFELTGFEPDQIEENESIDVPGGIVGAQALYSIFENIIRNAAKHGVRAGADAKKLAFNILLDDEWTDCEYDQCRHHKNEEKDKLCHQREWIDNYLRLSIIDNSNTSESKAEELMNNLDAGLIGNDGTPNQGSWGMKEIKICASYLRRIRQEDVDFCYKNWNRGQHPDHPPIVQISVVNVNPETKTGNLKYTFYLLQSKTAIVIDWLHRFFDEENFDREGYRNKRVVFNEQADIDCRRRNNFEEVFNRVGFRHKFVVLPEDVYQEVIVRDSRENELPYRIFVFYEGEEPQAAENNDSVIYLAKSELDQFENDPTGLRQFLWQRWMEKHFRQYRLCVRWDPTAERNLPEKLRREITFVNQGYPENSRQCFDCELKEYFIFDHRPDNDINAQFIKQAAFYDSLGSGTPTRRLAEIFAETTPETPLGEDSIERMFIETCMIKEAAAMRVAILDNRLFEQRAVEKTWISTLRKIRFDEAWEKRRVYLLDIDKATADFKQFVKDNIKGKKYDFLILHQGDIDTIESKLRNENREHEFQEAWEAMRESVKHIVIETGRGEPETARELNLRWVGYSALSDVLMKRSKTELVDLLFSLRANIKRTK